MKLLRQLEQVPEDTVATIGNFDGVHRGHQALLAELHQHALQQQLPMMVLIFEPQPSEYFLKDKAPARLTSLREKLHWLKHNNVDYVYCLRFNQHWAQMPAEAFAQQYFFSLLRIRYLLIGEDFRFGRERQGDIQLLQKLGEQAHCRVQIFPNFFIEQQRVSSTKIRQALAQGQLEQAATLLGRAFSLCGRVIRGEGRGKAWGIPTANLGGPRFVLPLKGVFCVQVRRSSGEFIQGVANLGTRPTVDGCKTMLEIHLFDFNDSLYGEMLEVFFLKKLREEVKFASIDALIAQIQEDIVKAKALFASESS